MTGWRVGYLAASKSIISQVTKILQCTVTNIAPFVQAGAIKAITSSQVLTDVKRMVSTYQGRYYNVLTIASKLPSQIKFNRPDGAFYFFVDARELGIRSEDIAFELLEKKNLEVIPGNVFGNKGEGFFRLTIAASDKAIQEGINALGEWLDDINIR